MPRLERVYKAVAHYEDGTTASRRFLDRRHRDSWAQQRRDGYPEQDGGMFGDERPGIPPALLVETFDSAPITYPTQS